MVHHANTNPAYSVSTSGTKQTVWRRKTKTILGTTRKDILIQRTGKHSSRKKCKINSLLEGVEPDRIYLPKHNASSALSHASTFLVFSARSSDKKVTTEESL